MYIFFTPETFYDSAGMSKCSLLMQYNFLLDILFLLSIKMSLT